MSEFQHIFNYLSTGKAVFKSSWYSGRIKSRSKSYVIQDGFLRRVVKVDGKVFFAVFIDNEVRKKKIFKENHNDAVGHLDQSKMLANIKPYYFWKKMSRDIYNWIRQCEICWKICWKPSTRLKKYSEISKELREWLKVNVVYGNDSISAFDAFTRFKNDNTHINVSSEIFFGLLGQDIKQTFAKATKRKVNKIPFYFGLKWIKERPEHVHYQPNMQMLSEKSHTGSSVYSVLTDNSGRHQDQGGYHPNNAEQLSGYPPLPLFSRHHAESIPSGNLRIDENAHTFSNLHSANQNSTGGSSNMSGAFNASNNRIVPPPQILSAPLNWSNLMSSIEKIYENQLVEGSETQRKSHTNIQETANPNYGYTSNSYGHAHSGSHFYSQHQVSSYSQTNSQHKVSSYFQTNSYSQSSSGIQNAPTSTAYQTSSNEHLVSMDGQQNSSSNQPTYSVPSEGSETDEIIYENKADKNKLNENTTEKKRPYEKRLNENTIKNTRTKENKSSENKPSENTPSENKLEEKKINEKKINNNRINEKQQKKNQTKENKVDENRMNNINQVMISGFHEHTTPSQIQAIVLAFSENEGNCRLGGTAILEKQLGITLIFDNPAVARLVISKYNQTEFLGFRIRVSTSHIKARYGEDKPVNYEIPSPPSPYRKVVNGRNMMRRVVTLKENKGGKESTKSSNTTSTDKNTTVAECLKELRGEANVRFKINKQKSPLLARVIQYNQHDSSTIPHQKGLLSTPPYGKGILNYPVASSFRNSSFIPVKPILDSKEKQEHNEHISYKVRLPSEHAFSKDVKVTDQAKADKFTVNDELINEKPKRRFVEHPSLQKVNTILPSVDKKLLEDNHDVKTTVPNQLNTSKSTANTIDSPAKTVAFTIKTVEPTLKTNKPPIEPQLKPKRKFTECSTLLSTTGHSKNKLVDKSIENNNVDVSSPKRKRYDKFANEMNKSIYHGFRGWRKRSITLMTSVPSKDKHLSMDSESTIPVNPIQSPGATPKKFSPVLISNEKQISSGNSLSESLTKATSIENNDKNLMFPIQTSESKQTKRKNRNYSPISDISQSDLDDVFDDEQIVSSNNNVNSLKAIVNKDYGSSSSGSSSKSSSDDASSTTSTCSTSSSEEDDSTSSSTEGCDKTCSSPEQNYATNDTVVVTEEEIKRDNRKQKRNEKLLEKNSHNNKEYIDDEQHQAKTTKENQCSSRNMTKVTDVTSVCSACHKKFKNLLCEDEVNDLVETNNNNEHTINKNITKNHPNTAEKSTQCVLSTDIIKVEEESSHQNNLLEKCCGTCDTLEEEKLEEFSKDCRMITSTVKILISKNPDLHNRLVTSCKSMLTELKERMLDHLHQDG